MVWNLLWRVLYSIRFEEGSLKVICDEVGNFGVKIMFMF